MNPPGGCGSSLSSMGTHMFSQMCLQNALNHIDIRHFERSSKFNEWNYQNHDLPCPDRGLTLQNLTKTNASLLER